MHTENKRERIEEVNKRQFIEQALLAALPVVARSYERGAEYISEKDYPAIASDAGKLARELAKQWETNMHAAEIIDTEIAEGRMQGAQSLLDRSNTLLTDKKFKITL